MDAFYVSVELLRHPELRGLPVVVGGTGGRGVVAAASYEARRYGIHSAISSAVARKLCPDAVFIAPDISHYVEFSQKLHTIFESFTPLVEQISIDEAFLDVTGASLLMGDAVSIAWALRERVVSETQLTCSVGVAPNKFLAKLASEHAKPRAMAGGVQRGYQVFEVKRGHESEFLLPLPVQSLWGVGPATLAKLEAIGVRLVADLAELDVDIVCSAVGDVNGRHLHALAHQNRIAVPANRRRTKIQRHGHIRRLGLQHRQRQRTDPRAKAAVHLLQRHNIGINFIQNRQDACRVAALIQPHRFTDIIGRNLDRVAHFGIMRSHQPYTGSGRICALISRPSRPPSAR